MLTDIFSARYVNRPLWTQVGESDRVLLVQCSRNVAEQVMPYYRDGKIDDASKKHWDSLESRLSMELGLEELSPHTYGFHNASNIWISGTWGSDKVCREWVLAEFKPEQMKADQYMKERVSFVELAFRDRDQWLAHDLQAFELMAKQGFYTEKNAVSTRRNHQLCVKPSRLGAMS
jgi:hypothetical protein